MLMACQEVNSDTAIGVERLMKSRVLSMERDPPTGVRYRCRDTVR